MNDAVIVIKTPSLVKSRAQQVAEELGFSLSSLVNAFLRQLVKTRAVYFSTATAEVPSEFLLASLKKTEKEIKTGRVSPRFTDTKEAIRWLNSKS